MPSQPAFDYDVFISYSSHDKTWVRNHLLRGIEEAGLSTFIDFRDFKPGVPGIKEMARGVYLCRKTLVVLTPEYIESGWCEIEKLQSTLEKRLGESFKQVGERLEQVYKGLGEMQLLATGVGDLKKVLTNVKSRGTWGEVQLGALLEQVLAPDQYAKNVATKDGGERVEFAVKLPGPGNDKDEVLWLPIDAKYPTAWALKRWRFRSGQMRSGTSFSIFPKSAIEISFEQ